MIQMLHRLEKYAKAAVILTNRHLGEEEQAMILTNHLHGVELVDQILTNHHQGGAMILTNHHLENLGRCQGHWTGSGQVFRGQGI